MNTVQHLIILVFISAIINADEGSQVKSESSQDSNVIYTESGIQRIHDNISILSENIQETENNISNIQKNIETIHAEIKELEQIVKDYGELRIKFWDKIKNVKEQMGQNEIALKKLHQFLKSLEVASKKQGEMQAIRTQQDSAMREIAEREKWKVDAKQMLKQLNTMLSNLEDAIRLLKRKQPDLEKELESWYRQAKSFQDALEEFKKQKQNYEQWIANRTTATKRSAP